MMGFFLATLMSHVAHTYFGGMITAFTEVGKIVIFYFLIVAIIDSKEKIKIMGKMLVLTATFMAVGGMLQYYRGFGFGGAAPFIEGGVVRVVGYGIFGDPNDLALFLAMSFPFALAFLFERKGFFSMVLISICSLTMVWATWLTNSRGGMFAFFVATIMFFRRRVKGFKWIFISLVITALILTFLPSRFTDRLLDISNQERVYFWGIGNQLFKQNPIFGVGYGMFPEYADWRSAHSSFVNCYADLGLFGYFFWIGLLYLVVLGLWKAKPSFGDKNTYTKEENNFLLLNDAILAGLCGYLISGIFLSRTYLLPLYLLIALGAKARYLITDGKYLTGDLLPAYYVRQIFLLSIGSILFLYLSTRFLLTRF
jgi:O-antigen ligase